MEAEPPITDAEVDLLFVKLPYGMANHPGLTFEAVVERAYEIVDDFRWCLRHAPEDILQIFGDGDPPTLPARLQRLTPRARTELLDELIRRAGRNTPSALARFGTVGSAGPAARRHGPVGGGRDRSLPRGGLPPAMAPPRVARPACSHPGSRAPPYRRNPLGDIHAPGTVWSASTPAAGSAPGPGRR
jgi:hypothetical protein